MPGPKLNITITVLPDGQVIFGDLPQELAEVASILAGEPLQTPGTEAGMAAVRSATEAETAPPLAGAGDEGDWPEADRPV